MVDESLHLRLHFLAFRRNNPWSIGFERAYFGNFIRGLTHDLQALAHLRDAYQIPSVTIGFRARWHTEVKFFVTGVGEGLAVIVRDPCSSKTRAGCAQGNEGFRGEITHALQPPLPDAIFREQGFVFVDARGHHLHEALDHFTPSRGWL